MNALAIAALLLGLASTVSAATKGKIYLDPDDQFSAYFSAALQKKKVPVTITTDPNQPTIRLNFKRETITAHSSKMFFPRWQEETTTTILRTRLL